MNVEVWLYAYPQVHMGHDQVTVVTIQWDEIKQYLDARWLSDAEAMYSFFHFHTHKDWPHQWKGYPSTSLMSEWGFMVLLDSLQISLSRRIAAKDTKLLVSLS